MDGAENAHGGIYGEAAAVLNWINTAFFKLNAVISMVFLVVTVAEVVFRGGFRLR